jgi:hypothetical protein
MSDLELLRLNQRALSSSDAMIAHGYNGGSCMLGSLMQHALDRIPAMPVVVFHHRGDKMSKSLLGLRDDYPWLEIIPFDDELDLSGHVGEWLMRNGEDIARGPARRRAATEDLRNFQATALSAWEAGPENVKAEVAKSMGLSVGRVDFIVHEPLQLSSLSTARLDLLSTGLNLDAERTIDLAMQVLDRQEVGAWKVWAKAKDEDYSLAVLGAAVTRRQDARISKHLGSLRQAGAWTVFAARWQRG